MIGTCYVNSSANGNARHCQSAADLAGARTRRELSDLLERFVLPLVKGGELAVGRPISIDQLRALEEAIPHATEKLVEVDDARTDVLSDLVVRPPSLVFDIDELALAAAVHNLLFLVHPRADSWSVTGTARLQSSQILRTRRCARTQFSADTN